MDSKVPIAKSLTGLGGHFDIPKKCKSIFQIMIIDLNENGKATNGFKLKIYNDNKRVQTNAFIN